jgi:hypothetical protein
MARRGRQVASVVLLVCAGIGCSRGTEPDCQIPPCPVPMAIVLSVTSAAGGPAADVTMTVSGAASGSGPCSPGDSATLCIVTGMPGTYNVRLTAPGFEGKALSVTVEGSSPPCGCTSVQTQRLSVVLEPS